MEVFIIRFLQENSACTLREIETALNQAFPGLQTPSLGLIQAVLLSYATESEGRWSLRPEETPSQRRADMESVTQSLAAIGTRLGYTIHRQESSHRLVLWQENGKNQAAFYMAASAVVGKLLRQAENPTAQENYLVLPGGRAGLLAYKFDRDPSLAALTGQWKIIKFRHIRRLAGMNTLTRAAFDRSIISDPIEPPEQMKLF